MTVGEVVSMSSDAGLVGGTGPDEEADLAVTAELRGVLSEFDLGELVDHEKNRRGFVNTAYAIETLIGGEHRKYFLRKYKRGIREEELQFEHSLIDHLAAAGAPVAGIHRTRSGSTYLRRAGGHGAASAFYTIFDFLPGDDRFTWIDPILNDGELAASAEALAQFHLLTKGFAPRGRRVEPRILELLPVIADTWSACPSKSKGTVFDARILSEHERLRANIANTLAALHEPGARALPEMMIHCDYHPGNLKFSGNRVSGMFDFDWSKIDFRLFDLGLALWYFCTAWRHGQDGCLRMDHVRKFLGIYQLTLESQAEDLALTAHEKRLLPIMINAGNLYVLHWTVLDYFAKDVDPEEYLVFLEHGLNFARCYEDSKDRQELEDAIGAAIRN